MAEDRSGDVTRILARWRAGEAQAVDDLLPLVYDELRALAQGHLRRERADHTLQATALVHEAYLRLLGTAELDVVDRGHFLGVAARAMRRVLVDHARRYLAGKRFKPGQRVSLSDAPELATHPDLRVLAVHQALERLHLIHPRQAQLVELRYFGGLPMAEAAAVLDMSLATARRDWKVAKLWLSRQLGREA